MKTVVGLDKKAKETLISYVELIDGVLKKYWEDELKNNFGFNDQEKEVVRKILLHSQEHNLRSAKRLRGSFVHYGYLLNGKETKEVEKAEVAVELVHTALLMHDDFMDEDSLRRGRMTTHKFFEGGDKHYGESMAVTVGDGVLCLGYELLTKIKLDQERVLEAMRQLQRGVVNTAFGQAYDISLQKMNEWTEDDVISLHKAKTAIYTYENPLLIGAILGGSKMEVMEALKKYSMDGGVAFQLQDDVLGVFGDEEDTGKSADSDLLHGKCTLLALKTLEMGNVKQKRDFKKAWGKVLATGEDIVKARKAIIDSGSYKYSVDLAVSFAAKAQKTANGLRRMGVNLESADYLEGIAMYMVNRKV